MAAKTIEVTAADFILLTYTQNTGLDVLHVLLGRSCGSEGKALPSCTLATFA
jgi:hypothetical protein